MTSPIPKIGTEGKFVLASPFDSLIDESKSYRCIAVRRFKDIRNNGGDVYRKYYFVHNVPEERYKKDDLNNEVIISLVSDFSATIYVPSSFIISFPNADTVPYHRVVISADLSYIADDMNLSALEQNVGNTISDTIGVVPTVNVHLAPYEGTVTSSEHEVIQTNRNAAIKLRSTDYVRVKELEQENERLQAQIKALKQALLKQKNG